MVVIMRLNMEINLYGEVTVGAVAGATAGVVVEAALYPIDTIKTRLQVCTMNVILLFKW